MILSCNRCFMEPCDTFRMPITYSWERIGLPMPTTAILEDHNRLLIIVNIQLEDAGTYVCHAKRGSTAQSQKSFNLQVEGKRIYQIFTKLYFDQTTWDDC